ncbi:cysteine-rich CWC family protein [Paenibacillus sacheonensis]|uniref:Cysteine-rich CWC n=1 Tax=Paenibacillus sacheonensis TaxID=742054 RepID=A0A7X5C3Z3_9BACL|nr:cysteine-rich CWC family protein [Paenibacillus sacheonensis]MBM7567298.1 hypothetical protein [Paenibacillus sacheonensis]NBC72810.1 hypothetical protein [Paenibacillus sacheonensis]
MTSQADTSQCPVCGNRNACAGSLDCWCAKEKFPKSVFAEIPAELLGKACVCKQCLVRFKQERRGRVVSDTESDSESDGNKAAKPRVATIEGEYKENKGE